MTVWEQERRDAPTRLLAGRDAFVRQASTSGPSRDRSSSVSSRRGGARAVRGHAVTGVEDVDLTL